MKILKDNYRLQKTLYYHLIMLMMGIIIVLWLNKGNDIQNKKIESWIILSFISIQAIIILIQGALYFALSKEKLIFHKSLLIGNIFMLILLLIFKFLEQDLMISFISIIYSISYVVISFILSKKLIVRFMGLPQLSEQNSKNLSNLKKSQYILRSFQLLHNIILIFVLFIFYMSIRNIESTKSKILLTGSIIILLFLRKILKWISLKVVTKKIKLISTLNREDKDAFYEQYRLKNNLNNENSLLFEKIVLENDKGVII